MSVYLFMTAILVLPLESCMNVCFIRHTIFINDLMGVLDR